MDNTTHDPVNPAPIQPTDATAGGMMPPAPVDPMAQPAPVPDLPIAPVQPIPTPDTNMPQQPMGNSMPDMASTPVAPAPAAPVLDTPQASFPASDIPAAPVVSGPVTNEALMEELQKIEDRLDEMDEKL